jgi:CTP synthase (UTP-ammonia lyase)
VKRIALLIDLPRDARYFDATVEALRHAIDATGADCTIDVVRTDQISEPGAIGDGVVIGPGSPYRDPSAAEAVIRHARERGVPLVGT